MLMVSCLLRTLVTPHVCVQFLSISQGQHVNFLLHRTGSDPLKREPHPDPQQEVSKELPGSVYSHAWALAMSWRPSPLPGVPLFCLAFRLRVPSPRDSLEAGTRHTSSCHPSIDPAPEDFSSSPPGLTWSPHTTTINHVTPCVVTLF